MVGIKKRLLRDELAEAIAEDKNHLQTMNNDLGSMNNDPDSMNNDLTPKYENAELELADLKRKITHYENPDTPPSLHSLQYKQSKRQKRQDHNNPDNQKPDDQKVGHKCVSHNRRSEFTIHQKDDNCRQCGSSDMTHTKSFSRQTLDVPEKPKATVQTEVKYKSCCNNCSNVSYSPDMKGTGIGKALASEIISLWEKRE